MNWKNHYEEEKKIEEIRKVFMQEEARISKLSPVTKKYSCNNKGNLDMHITLLFLIYVQLFDENLRLVEEVGLSDLNSVPICTCNTNGNSKYLVYFCISQFPRSGRNGLFLAQQKLSQKNNWSIFSSKTIGLNHWTILLRFGSLHDRAQVPFIWLS